MIEVVHPLGLCTIQDLGRPGLMHMGIPPGGALVPSLLARANVTARNAPHLPAIEILGGSLSVTSTDPVEMATDDGELLRLAVGETLRMACTGTRARYLAIRGGFDVPVVLGGRGTLVSARFGGHEGRTLRAGDRLGVGDAAAVQTLTLPAAPDFTAPIRVMLGPDVERFSPEAVRILLSKPFAMTDRSDRVGARLAGPRIPREDGDLSFSAPMIQGALQVPASGEIIVLGPDHPTMGGYPVIATVVQADLGALMGRMSGAGLTFVLEGDRA